MFLITSRLERTKLSEKMIEEDLSRVDECVTRSIHKLGLGYERYQDKSEISTKFVPSSTYKDEEETLKAKQISYPSNPKPSFNLKRAQKQTTNPSMPNLDGVYTCMFYCHAGHLYEFYFRRKRMEKRRVDYARNSYHNEFIDFLPHFSHGTNHRSNDFGSRESGFVPRRFGFNPRSYRGSRPPCRHGSPARGVYSHFEPSCFDGPRLPRRGSRPTHSNCEAHKTVVTCSCHMVKCWIPKIFLTNPSTEPSTFSCSM
jgi:hypothetical protein